LISLIFQSSILQKKEKVAGFQRGDRKPSISIDSGH